MAYRPGETVELYPVEWVVEEETYLTDIRTTYRTPDGRKVYVESQVPRRDRDIVNGDRLTREALAEQLSHVSVTFPE